MINSNFNEPSIHVHSHNARHVGNHNCLNHKQSYSNGRIRSRNLSLSFESDLDSSSKSQHIHQRRHHNHHIRESNYAEKQNYHLFRRAVNFVLRPHILTMFFLLVSIIGNQIYFNLYYLPELINSKSITAPVEKSSSYSSQSSSSSSYFNHMKSFDHVVFPTLSHHSPAPGSFNHEPDEIIQLNNNDDKNELYGLNEIGIKELQDRIEKTKSSKKLESQMALNLALTMLNEGKYDKAAKIYKYALSLDPQNSDALASYGEFLELHKKDVLKAEHLYTRALRIQPEHDKANMNRKRTLPLVTKMDQDMLDKLDKLLKEFYEIPTEHSALKRAKRDAYYMHIYHSNAIEGNSLNLHQTRHILETRMAINGKSLLEHQEVLGLDAALRYINETLIYRQMGVLSMNDIIEIHKRVLGFCDPIEAGKFRHHQVYVGNFVPPPASQVAQLMGEFIEWINSKDLLAHAHPIQVAALAHYKFVYIHPFYDGNGRTGRLLMNLILMRAGYPPIIIRKQERLEYYELLEMANHGDVRPFIRFIARCTQRTLNEYIRLCNNSHGIEFERNELARNYHFSDNLLFDDYVYASDHDLPQFDPNEKIILPDETLS